MSDMPGHTITFEADEFRGVTLVGGGPGDPELITVGGLKALLTADVVVTDRLAPQELLAQLPPTVELIDVAKLPRSRSTAQADINELLVSCALAGKRVVRLKGGDNYVFGRGFEEVLALQDAGVPVRVIPGLTSSIAVPALAGVPVTHRGVVHDFTVVSGHLPPGHRGSLVDWDALGRMTGTLVLLMAVENARAIAERLIASGRPARQPVAVIAEGSLPTERVVRTTLGSVGTVIEAENVRPPAIIVIGEVVGLAPHPEAPRDRVDRCPGALRPWRADDGLLVRIRLIGGRIRASQLQSLAAVARDFGDGRVHVTSRSNLQLRGFGAVGDRLDAAALAALDDTGLLPSRSHELVRNVLVSPQTGLSGGRVDLRAVADELDRALCANPRLAQLPGRFLFALDDGRGDLLARDCDLGLVALDEGSAQLRIGAEWGPVVELREAAVTLVGLAERFLAVRENAWHVTELDVPLADPVERDGRVPAPAIPLPYGEVPGGRHVPIADDGLDADAIAALTEGTDELIVTPWRGVLIPEAAL